MTRKWYVVGIALAVIALLAFSLTGCQKAAEEIAEGIIEESTGGDIEIDDDSVSIETEDGSTVEISGSDAEIPDDFPDDFPIYDADVESSSRISSDDGTGFYIGLVTDDSYEDVFEWYKEELADEGWEILTEMTTGESGSRSGMLMVSKGESEGGVTFGEDGDVTRMAISLNIK